MVEVTVPFKKIKLENENPAIIKTVALKQLTEWELYIKLQLGVLHSLRAGRRSSGPPTAVNAQHVAALAPRVHAYAQAVLKKGGRLLDDERLQVPTERYQLDTLKTVKSHNSVSYSIC